jgi:hypothetical protein
MGKRNATWASKVHKGVLAQGGFAMKMIIKPVFYVAIVASTPAWGLPITAQHTTNNSSGDIFARDIEFFGVDDTLEFRGTTDHNLNILGGPAVHDVHVFRVGDKFSFNTRIEFSAQRFDRDDGSGRPLFVPTGEVVLGPPGGSLVGLTAPSRELRIRTNDMLFGDGAPGAIFDYSSPWAIAVNDNITIETATTTSTLGIGGGAVGFSVAVTKALNSPTTATLASGFDDLFEFELSQPQNQGGVNSDSSQGFFAAGGTLVVTGFLEALRPTNGDDFIWFDNHTAVTFDGIFEFQDPNPGLGTDVAFPGGSAISYCGEMFVPPRGTDTKLSPWNHRLRRRHRSHLRLRCSSPVCLGWQPSGGGSARVEAGAPSCTAPQAGHGQYLAATKKF